LLDSNCVGFEFERAKQIQIQSLPYNTPRGPPAHRPTQPQAQLTSFPFLFFPARHRPSTTGPAHRRDLSRRFAFPSPGAADGRVPPVSFPFFLRPLPLPARSATHRRSPPPRDRIAKPLLLFSPRPRSPTSPRACLSPLRDSAAQPPARAPFSPMPRPPALQNPSPALQPLDARRVAVVQTPGIAALGVRARAASPRVTPIKTPRSPPEALATRTLFSIRRHRTRERERRRRRSSARGGGPRAVRGGQRRRRHRSFTRPAPRTTTSTP
jgi:hypothetical protein